MNKTLRNLALVALVAAPFSAFAEIKGAGTEADPYQIATAADLAKAYSLTKNAETVYFVQTADITFTDAENAEYVAVCGYMGSNYNNPIVYDGKNHVIKGFAPKQDTFTGNFCYGQSVFGALIGSVKNLGIEGAVINASNNGRAGIVCGYFGVNNSNAEALALFPVSTLENVYVTGTVKGSASNYTGGLFGTTGTEVSIKNCFANVNMTASGAGKNGAFAGRINHKATITNCYVAGTVGENVKLVAGDNTGATTYDGFVVFNTGSDATGLVETNTTGEITMANTSATKADGIAEVQDWEAFSATENVNGYPALASFAGATKPEGVQGSGTEADPWQVASAEDLAAVGDLLRTDGSVNYIIQTADITMTDAVNSTWLPYCGGTGQTYDVVLNYDGQNHVIDGFKPAYDDGDASAGHWYAQSLFGVLFGTVKNLGITNVEISAGKNGRAGAICGYLGTTLGTAAVLAASPIQTIENVFVTGKVVGGKDNYTGGLFGTTGTEVVITNCFVNVEMSSEAGDKNGAFAGRLNNPTTITNCYVAGTVSGTSNLVTGANTGTVTYDGFVVFNTGSENTGIVEANKEGEITMANTAASKEDGIAEVQDWTAFSETKVIKGFPILKSFEAYGEELSGIFDAAVEEADAPAVYYNLQGVQVNNPENGIYIVRRGNKVTKEVIR